VIKPSEILYPEFEINFCPDCLMELPKSLLPEWKRITEEEFGVYDLPFEARLEKIPEEFRTEEWWVKRGL